MALLLALRYSDTSTATDENVDAGTVGEPEGFENE
jgi:hypothetical protein